VVGAAGVEHAPQVRVGERAHLARRLLELLAPRRVRPQRRIHPPERQLDLDLAIEHAVVDVGRADQGAGAHLVAPRDQRAVREALAHPSRPWPPRPVEPKPPAPRSLGGSAPTSSTAARVTGAITSWAMRSPGSSTASSRPRLTSRTMSSPR